MPTHCRPIPVHDITTVEIYFFITKQVFPTETDLWFLLPYRQDFRTVPPDYLQELIRR